MTRFETGYNKGVSDCLAIMSDLSEKYEGNEAVESMYCEWLQRVRKLKDNRL